MHPRDQFARRPADLDERHSDRPARAQTEQRHEVGRKPVLGAEIETVRRTTDGDCRDRALARLDARPSLGVVGQRLDESRFAFAQKRDQCVALAIEARVVEPQQTIARGERYSCASSQRVILQGWCYASEVHDEVQQRSHPIVRSRRVCKASNRAERPEDHTGISSARDHRGALSSSQRETLAVDLD